MHDHRDVYVITSARHVPDDAVRWGAALSGRWNRLLTLVDLVDAEVAAERRAELDRIAERIDERPRRIETAVLADHRPRAVADAIADESLVILPPDGRRAGPATAWGSFATELASSSRHLVLRVRTAASTRPLRILAPLDVDDHAVVDHAAWMCRETGAELRLLVPHRHAERLGSLLRQPTFAGLRTRIDVIGDVDAAGVEAAALRNRADMLVVPSSGTADDSGWLVRHTRFSVLAVPTDRAPAVAAA